MKPTLHFLSAALLLATAACGALNNEPPDIQFLRESRPIGSAKDFAVNLKYDVGEIEVKKTSDENLFAIDLQYDQRRFDPKFDFSGSGDHATMRLDMNSRRGLNNSRGKENDLTLRLSEKVPLDLDITTGVSESRLDMTGLQLRKMHLRGGVGKTEVSFDKVVSKPVTEIEVESGVGEFTMRGLGNARVERLDIKGGVGRTEIDFTGDLGTARIDSTIEVGVGQVRLMVPRDADIEIQADGSFLSNISAPSFEHSGHMYTHRGDGGGKVNIRVKSGIGGVKIDLM